MSRHRSSIQLGNKIGVRQLLIIVGVFLSANIIDAQPVNAKSAMFDPLTEKFSLVDSSEKQMKALDKLSKEQQSKLKERLKTVSEVKKETDALASAKADLEASVNDVKAQVEQLQARLEEKRRLEALRIVPQGRYSSDASGNGYVPGNCTWYVKQKRPDIGNFWGNAKYWYGSAQSEGYKTGTMAKTGAIGVSFDGWAGHVVYVEQWLGDGRILISEMNYGGLYVTDTREASESDFVYIYEL